MRADELTLERWDGIDSAERLALARRLAAELPATFRLRGLEEHTLGGITHEVACFTHEDLRFMLIPGGLVTLGYDAEHPFEPTTAQLEDWKETVADFGLTEQLTDYIAQAMTPLRRVMLRPFLVQIGLKEAGVRPLAPDSPEAIGPVGRHTIEHLEQQTRSPGSSQRIEVEWLGLHLRAVRRSSGEIKLYRLERLSHQAMVDEVDGQGFRLPTSDEWEHACRAGSRTLFRWGDDCPNDCYPIDGGDWDMHRRPNAFGLQIASSPYDWEFVAEPDLMRGGDGGGACCGGLGYFPGWLTLASSYREQPGKDYLTKPVTYAHFRRVVPLG